MNENLQIVCRHLESQDIHFETDAERHLVVAPLQLTHTAVHLLVHAPPEEAFLGLFLQLPMVAPAERRPVVGEFLHRANQFVRTGAFDFDYDTGEVRFSMTAQLALDYTLPEETFRRWLVMAVITVDGFTPLLMRVAFGNLSPASAMEQSEAFLKDYMRQLGLPTD